MLTPLYILGGLLLLFAGGELIVKGSTALAKRIGISELAIGLTVVAFGTSAPELFVSANAALDGHYHLAIGNVVGSNISNILLVLGATALIHPIHSNKKVAGFDNFVMLAATLLVVIFSWSDQHLSRVEGAMLFALLVLYVYLTVKKAKADHEEPLEHFEEMRLITALNFLVFGLLALVYGSDFLVTGAIDFARMIGVSEAVIGLTIVAVGSSAPELATSLMAAFRKKVDIAIGNIVGSNIFNLLSILGITAYLTPVAIGNNFLSLDYWILGGVTLTLSLLLIISNSINRLHGSLFLLGYASYVTFLYLGN